MYVPIIIVSGNERYKSNFYIRLYLDYDHIHPMSALSPRLYVYVYMCLRQYVILRKSDKRVWACTDHAIESVSL